jgi:uncharacterized protein YuzE
MNYRYYPDTDSLYIDLTDQPSVEAEEIAPQVVVDRNAQGDIVGFDVDQASRLLHTRDPQVEDVERLLLHLQQLCALPVSAP